MEGADQDRVLDLLLGILKEHPAGIKEYDLLQRCRGMGVPFLEADSLRDPLILYRVHFLLFHCLYLLQNRLRQRREGDLTIHCLGIILKPWPGEESALPAVADPLRLYYLDWDQAEAMTRQEAQSLIDGFWQRFDKWDRRQEALAVLDLQEPATAAQITHRYRQLAMTHHPDRGGNPEQFRQIAQAMEQLR